MRNRRMKRKDLTYGYRKRHKRSYSYAFLLYLGSFFFSIIIAFLFGGVTVHFLMQRQAEKDIEGASIISAQLYYGGSGAGLSKYEDSVFPDKKTDERISDVGSSDKWNEIFENEYKYPEELINALKRNPEILDFASGYLTADKKASGGITAEEEKEECPLFLQWDKRWGYVSYGRSNIGISGCGPTCLSMVLYSFTRDKGFTPDVLAEQAMEEGYYVSGAGTAWNFMDEVAERYGLFVIQDEVWEEGVMKTYLNDGRLLICAMGPGDFTDTGHFIVIRGYSDGKFLVNDPFSVSNSNKKWDYDTIADQCRQMWAYELIKK